MAGDFFFSYLILIGASSLEKAKGSVSESPKKLGPSHLHNFSFDRSRVEI